MDANRRSGDCHIPDMGVGQRGQADENTRHAGVTLMRFDLVHPCES